MKRMPKVIERKIFGDVGSSSLDDTFVARFLVSLLLLLLLLLLRVFDIVIFFFLKAP